MQVVVLAAGKGTRMENILPKVLVPIKGKPMIEYLVKSIVKSGVDKHPIIVVSPDNKKIISGALKKYHCLYAMQEEQLGTGHALFCAKGKTKKRNDAVIMFYGDHPFVKKETIKKLADSANGGVTMATTRLKDFKNWRANFHHWGRIVRSRNKIEKIVEFKDADDKIKRIKEVNPGFYCFNNSWLWENIDKLKNKNAQKEYYITDLIGIAFDQGLPINSITINPSEAVGINTKEELAVAERLIK